MRIYCFVLLAALQIPLLAQRVNIRTFGPRDGLPLGQPLALYEGRAGFLWIATYAGLTRYDGSEWLTWTRHDGLPADQIMAIGENADGVVIGFEDSGLWQLARPPRRLFPEVLGAASIRALELAPDNTLWVGTDAGLFRCRNQQIRPLRTAANDQKVVDLLIADDRLWIAHQQSVYCLPPGAREPIPVQVSGLNEIRFLATHGQGRIMAGTTKGLMRLDEIEPFHAYPADAEGVSTAAEAAGVLWVTTLRSGLIGWSEGAWYRLNQDHGLPDPNVRSVVADRNGHLWIGSDEGLSRFSRGHFVVFDSSHGLPHPFVRAVFVDRDGLLWVGTRQGPARYIKPEFEALPLDLFPDPLIYAIGQDAVGRMLFATRSGFTVLEGDRSTHYDKTNGLDSEIMVSLHVDQQGRVWLGGEGLFEWLGANRFETRAANALKGTSVITIADDGLGGLWLGTSRGLYRYNTDTGVIKDHTSDVSTTIWSIAIEPGGSAWFATNGLGVARFDGANFSFIDTSNGLTDDFVWQVLRDGDDLWAAHSRGISRLNDQGWRHFGLNDGIADMEASATACAKGPDGRLWFGSGSGITCYASSQTPLPHRPPGIMIHRVRGASGLLGEGEIGRDSMPITFEFGAIDLSGEPTTYSYRLKGLSPAWSDPTRLRAVTFAGLDPGQYTFEVKAFSLQGEPSRSTARWQFHLPKAIWERLPFRLSMVVLTLLLVFAVVRLRTLRLHRRRAELELIVTQRTLDLNQANDELVRVQEQLIQSAHEAGMTETARQFLHHAGNALNSMRVAVFSLANLSRDATQQRFLQGLSQMTNSSQAPTHETSKKMQRAVSGLTDLLEGQHQKALKELIILEEGLESLTQIVRDQENLARDEQQSDPVDVAALLRGLVHAPPPWLKPHTDSIHLALPSDLPKIMAPRGVLVRVIREVLRNAVESIQSNSKSSAPSIKIQAQTHGQLMTISIIDQGVGMPRDQVVSAFRYGFSTKEGASGFGLHYCANAVRDMGGRMDLHSDGPGRGVHCSISLPVAVAG